MRLSGLVVLGRFVLLFVASVLIGCILAGFLSVLHQVVFEKGELKFGVALMIGASYPIFAIVPAIIFGIPAVLVLRWRKATKPQATTALIIGGGAVGGLLISAMSTTFATWGVLTGGSVGFMSGVLMFPSRELRPAHG